MVDEKKLIEEIKERIEIHEKDYQAFKNYSGDRKIKDISKWDECTVIIELIEKQPIADVAPIVHGEWLRHEPNPRIMEEFHEMGIGKGMSINSVYWTCSECGCLGTPSHNYCFKCGAKMDGKEN